MAKGPKKTSIQKALEEYQMLAQVNDSLREDITNLRQDLRNKMVEIDHLKKILSEVEKGYQALSQSWLMREEDLKALKKAFHVLTKNK